MTQSPRNGRKRSGGKNEPAIDPDSSTDGIKARLKLLDLRLELLQKDLVNLTMNRRHVALARSQYRTRLNLEPMDRKSDKKRKVD